MTINIDHKPVDFSFAADGVAYQITISPDTGEELQHKQIFTFRIEPGSGEAENIAIVSFPTQNTQGQDVYNIDLSDIISALTSTYQTSGRRIISGYVSVRLWEVGDVSVSDPWATILPGTAGGVKLTGELPANIHPFLLARGNEEGSLHFYRSELAAMEYIYAIIPDAYTGLKIGTDDATVDIQSQVLVDVYAGSKLFGIYLNATSYSIAESANALFVGFHNFTEDIRSSMLSIMEDPDTDDTHMLKWINSMGATEVLLLTGEMRDISEIDNPDLYITMQTPRETQRSYLRRSVTTKYSLQTGYLTPARICALKDLLTSDSVYIKQDDQWIQVLVSADTAHAVHQRDPENFELTIEVMAQTRYYKPNRTVNPLPSSQERLLQDNSGNLILDNNSNTIQENG